MKKRLKTKEIVDFRKDMLLNSNSIVGGGRRGKGEIDRDKAGRPPKSGH